MEPGSSAAVPATPLEQTVQMKLKEQPAISTSSNISYKGCIKDNADVCWVSFPGAYASGWDALVGQRNADSVACVFLATPEDGTGLRLEFCTTV